MENPTRGHLQNIPFAVLAEEVEQDIAVRYELLIRSGEDDYRTRVKKASGELGKEVKM